MMDVTIQSHQIFRLFWAFFGTITVATTVLVPACADQNDPQLDDLFIALQAGPSATQAATLELEIWNRWGDQTYDPLEHHQLETDLELMTSENLIAA